MYMKTIFLTISRGNIARNLLQNDFYKILREKYKIIMLTPAATDERFCQEFAHTNVTFVDMQEKNHSRADKFLFFFHKNLIYNSTVNQKNRWGSPGDSRSKQSGYFLFLVKKVIFIPLSKVKPLRDVVRWFDKFFLQKEEVAHFVTLLETYKPDVVTITNVSSDTEIALLKAAKEKNIKTLAIPKSWDNLSKHGFRAKADIMVVWSDFMKKQTIEFQNYKEQDIRVIGIPQFDYYADKTRLQTREQFCSLYNLDPKKKIIFFGSEGKLFPTDSEIASILYEMVSQNTLSLSAQLLVRPHYGYKNDEQKFSHLFDKPNVTVDLQNTPSAFFRDEWDYSQEFMNRFLNTLYHSDVIVNTCSTLSLDGVAFDKPLISIAFDGYQKKRYNDSILRWYETHYYDGIVQTGAVSIVKDRKELQSEISEYLLNPERKVEERKILRDHFCHFIDGKAGERFASVIEEALS